MPVTQRITAEEYLALPEPPELRRAELVDGELIVHEPKPLHQLVVAHAPSFDVALFPPPE